VTFVRRRGPGRVRASGAAIGVLVSAAVSGAVAPGRGVAQARPRLAAGAEIVLLGTKGGPDLSRDRSEPATLLIVDGRPYLIDCGIGTMRRLLAAGVPSPDIRTIFLTHDHPDHVLGLADVMANDLNGVEPTGGAAAAGTFAIYGPPPTAALVAAAWSFVRISYGVFAAEHLGGGTLGDPFRVHVIARDGLVYRDDLIRVTAAENTHYRLMPAQERARMKSDAYRFETPYGVIVFTGDTGPSEAVARLAAGADLLVSEVEDLDAIVRKVQPGPVSGRAQEGAAALLAHLRLEHLTMRAVGELAFAAHAKAILLHHYVPPEDTATYLAGVKRYYTGPVFAGEDLARYCLGPAGAGGAAPAVRPCP
jgi:ribonuclease BN (tRNA processing enzyme)